MTMVRGFSKKVIKFVEGGRIESEKFVRRCTRRRERKQVSTKLARILRNFDLAENYVDPPRPRSFGYSDGGHHNLSLVFRWLEAQVDKPWNHVLSQARRTFGDQRVDGHDVVTRFVINRPAVSDKDWFRSGGLFVDENGFLRKAPKRK
ncbi:MAG: hypothetical protein ABIH21_05350 [Patescibacteria group bacterium]